MFTNYIRTAWRNIQRHKGYAFINISGLAIGMACCILIIIFILTELTYDKFHQNANRIYRLGIDANVGGNVVTMPISNNPTALVLAKDFSEVVSAVRLNRRSKLSVKFQGQHFFEEEAFYADNSIFEVFSFPLIKGDPHTALKTAYSLVLTEETAQKIFRDTDPLGKILRINDEDDYTVTGVVKNVPRNSHFTFNILCSFETRYAKNRRAMEVWLNFNNYTYLLLQEGFNAQELEQKFPTLIEQYMGKTLKALGGEIKFFLQPLTSIHLHSHMEGELSGNGNILYVYIFSAIALFILFIACINFMNLATARSATRAREVSMRKVVGAQKRELIIQFLGESLLYSSFSLVLACGLVYLALPFFRSMTGIPMEFNLMQMPWLIPGFIGLVLFVGLIAGSYPALFLSAFQPAAVLKGGFKAGAANSRFRSVLVTAQFFISIVLIIGTFVIVNQLRFMKKKSLGFDQNHIIVSRIMDDSMEDNLDAIKFRIKQIPGVEQVSASSIVPGQQPDVSIFIPEGFTEDQSQLMERINIDTDYLPTLGIDIVAGRNFSREFGTDSTQTAIINETAVKRYGWENPLGKKIKAPGDKEGQWRELTVIGVVKDYHIASLHRVIAPMIMTHDDDYYNTLAIRLNRENQAATLSRLKSRWSEVDPVRPLDYFFLDETFDRQYRGEERLSEIIASFSIFAIFIACLGLFGMASFTAERRTKEIGIRKVLGATIPGLISLLSKDFLKHVLLANIVAWPIAFWAMRKWLQNFAYRTGVSLWIFLATGFLAVAISLLTVSYQSIKAALSNPVDAIKYE